MLLSRIAVGLLAVLGLGLAGAGTAAADDASWVVRTAANELGDDRPNYSYTVNPGDQVSDGLVVVNRGTTPLDLSVYAADGFTTKSGRLDLLTRNAKSTGVGVWVRPAAASVHILPGKSAEVPFTVTVPAGAEPGDHLGGIVASLSEGKLDRRVGIRIHLRVGGALEPRVAVEDLRVRYAGTPNPFGTGDATLTYTVHNTGNAILAARSTAAVNGPFGRWRVPAKDIADTPQLLPGETWQVSVPLEDVTPAVSLAAKVSLVPLLADAAGSIAPLAATSATSQAWAVPWTLLLVVLLVVALVVAGLLAVRRGRRATMES